MKLIKFSSIFAILGFTFFGMSYFVAKGLEESKQYSFPESVGRHYARVSGKVFEGGNFGTENATFFKKSIPMGSSFSLDSVEVETVAVNVEISKSETDEIEIELHSHNVDPKEPILIDSSRGKTLRIMTQEGASGRRNRNGWMVFNWNSDDEPVKNNVLQVRVPKSVLTVKIQTASGRGKLATALQALHFQSKSGDFGLALTENPLARVSDLKFESVSGDLKTPGRFDRLTFNTVSGNIVLSNLDRVLEIAGHSVSGDLILEASETPDVEVAFHSTSGAFTVAKSLRSKGMIAPKMNAPYILGRGKLKINTDSVSGNLKIRRSKGFDDDEEERQKIKHDDDDAKHESKKRPTYAVTRVGNAASLARFQSVQSSAIAAEDMLRCAARISVKESTRMGSASIRRCLRVVV